MRVSLAYPESHHLRMTSEPSGRLYSAVTKYWPKIAASLVGAADVAPSALSHAALRWLRGQDMSSVPVPVLAGPHGTGPRGLFPVSEDDGPDYREDDCQADAEDEEYGWAERPAATVLGLLLELPATSLLRRHPASVNR